jgi:hypothetical protein
MINMKFCEVNETNAESHVDESLTVMDNQRLKELQELKQLQSVKTEILTMEMKRRSAVHGDNDIRVMKMAARVDYDKNMMSGLDIQIKDAQENNPPPLPPKDVEISGNIIDANEKPVLYVMASLEDEKNTAGKFQAPTDDKGQYLIKIPGDKIDSLQKKPMFIKVYDRTGRLLHTEEKPLLIEPGKSIVRNIQLGRESHA